MKKLLGSLFFALLIGVSYLVLTTPTSSLAINTTANLKVAFIGDSGAGSNFENVLNLIKNEGASMVIHNGDFDYGSNPNNFKAKINQILGANFPYVYVVGNHDIEDAPAWNVNCGRANGCYAKDFQDRMLAAGINIDVSGGGSLDRSMYSLEYQGLKIVAVGKGDFDNSSSGVGNATYAPFIRSKLQNDNHVWKICAWHESQKNIQLGDKGDAMGWGVYEACREMGAIITVAHEHSYHRTKTLTNFQNLVVDPNYVNRPDEERVERGKSFAVVSGLGGASIRSQGRCTPTSYPYGLEPGCNNIWASVYTSSQGAREPNGYGASFMVFNVDGDPSKAKGYFKNVSGQIIDQYTITTTGSSGTNPPSGTATATATARATATATANPTATPGSDYCDVDINQDFFVNQDDYNLFVNNFLTNPILQRRADINSDGIVDISDYAILADHYGAACRAGTPGGGASTAAPNPTATARATATANPTTTPGGSVQSGRLFGSDSPFNKLIPTNAVYTREDRIGTFRPVYEEWSMPLYRVNAGVNVPLVTATVTSSGRTVSWPIPTTANPAPEADAHMGIINRQTNTLYEFWEARWNSTRTAISAGGMKDFALNGNGISNPVNYRVTASGFAVSAGLVTREDMQDNIIDHALSMALSTPYVSKTYVAPAVGGEEAGTGDIPMGARYALPKTLNINALTVHPLTKALLQAARDYGIYVNDGKANTNYQGKELGAIRIEPGLIREKYGIENNQLLLTIQQEVYNVISANGLFRVTGITY